MTTTPSPGVVVRTVTVSGLPLLLAGVPLDEPGGRLWEALAERGLRPLERVAGAELPRGAELGFVVDRDELRLVDPTDTPILRAGRDGLADAWLEAAKRLKGTMCVAVADHTFAPDAEVAQLVREADEAAAAGRAVGAIVGLVEERPTLPLLFG